MSHRAITVARGDGIGPEIMDAVLHILAEAGARIEIEEIPIGEKVFLSGHPTGVTPEAWESIRRTHVFLKAPITTPQGGGFKSLNVTTRKMFGLYANVRPCVAYHPFVATKHPGMDVVIVRENEEDLYAGIEHRQTDQVVQCLKLISRAGCERIVRYAFEYARRNNRKKVTCFTKDNIMKLTDGLFHKVFDEIAREYPDLVNEHWIVDIGAAKLADTPCVFDVVVMPNLYGDILSDVAAQIAGSVGLAGSANIGEKFAMFEAIHGSAPRRAGQNVANPSGLLQGAIMMLVHIGQPEVASLVQNAWLKTVEDGIHTYDVFAAGVSKEKVGTREFARAVVQRLGQSPKQLRAVEYTAVVPQRLAPNCAPSKAKKELIGVDVFLDHSGDGPRELARRLEECATGQLALHNIAARGVKVYPDGFPEAVTGDHWRCRFMGRGAVSHRDVIELLARLEAAGFDFIKTEHLYIFDGQAGFTA
ncbi:MAG: NADP-dependent isocitrate dehydrogenase [Bryobacteraceae bacterium]